MRSLARRSATSAAARPTESCRRHTADFTASLWSLKIFGWFRYTWDLRWSYRKKSGGGPRACLEPRDHALPEALPQPLPVFFSGIGVAPSCWNHWILSVSGSLLILILQNPPKRRQSHPISLTIDSLIRASLTRVVFAVSLWWGLWLSLCSLNGVGNSIF